jgi:ABC-type transport system involved in Fe-S cluster assembly fused permease/ATPase subunit
MISAWFPKLLDVAAAVITVLFVFVSFLINYERETPRKSSVLRKTTLRVVSVLLASASYIAEAAIVSRQRHEPSQIQDHLLATLIFALAWASTCFRKELLIPEVFGLSSISLLFGIPVLILHATYPAVTSMHEALLAIEFVRQFIVVGLLTDCLVCSLSYKKKTKQEEEEEEEVRPFLNGSNSQINQVSYGTEPLASRPASTSDSSSDDWDSDGEENEPENSQTGQLRKSGSWMVYIHNFKVFLPYLIPRKNLEVQSCLLGCVLCLVGDRFLNILVPRQLGIIADKLFARQQPFSDLGIYFALALLHGDSGLQMIKSLAKIPIEQFSYRQLTNAAFNHVMGLEMEFHSDRDSAEVMKAIEQGEALTNLLETAVLEIAPTVIDMVVAIVFLYIKFNSSAALCMLLASLAFMVLEVLTSSWNVENRRRLTKAERAEARVMHQAIQGWQTVSAFNMFSYEKFRFRGAVDKHLLAKKDWSRRDAYTSGLTEALVPMTFFALACLVAREVCEGHASPGDFVFLTQYWEYLVWPIKYLSHEYRYLMANLIDAEKLLDLLTTQPTVEDKEGALELGHIKGLVEFEHVGFSYLARKSAIQDVNISASPGDTIALVGATGAGKTSLMKLLLRYYDVTSGSIKIDGYDVRDITQGSLRNFLGVVTQDPVLFNTSIIENLRYAKLSASDEEIYDACRAAAIHDKIMSFPKGYHTKVGEQGVKLSGGEVQRLAIARVFLKDPPILVLDEATSSIDTETESEIQGALKRLSRKRTTFVIAHRLSTVVHADQILVLGDGMIVERGTHAELLEKRDRYYGLWQRQFLGSGEAPLLET